jgi:hypothetical protein
VVTVAREAAPNSTGEENEIHFKMNGKKSDFDGYAKWSKEYLPANVASMRAFPAKNERQKSVAPEFRRERLA